jgi:hypothetical protein
MIDWFKKFDNVMLVFLAAVPPVLYGFGYAKTGSQIFSFSEREVEDVVIMENPRKEVGLIPADQIPKEAERLQEERAKDLEARRKVYKDARKLGERVTTLGNVARPAVVDTVYVELDTTEASPAVVQELKPKPVYRAPVVVQKKVEKEEVPEDPWASWSNPDEGSGEKNTSGYITENYLYGKTDDPGDKGKFDEHRLYKAQFVQDKTYDLSKRNHVWLLRSREEIILRDGTIVPSNTVFSGNVNVSEDKITIDVNRIKLRHSDITTHMYVVDQQGNEGLRRQGITEAMKQTDEQLDEIINEASNDISVGTPFGNLTIPTRTRNGKEEIIVSSSLSFYLKVK